MDAAILLADARARAGLTLRQLAARAGTSHSTLVAYEAGRVEPSVATVSRILRAAGFELDAVVTRRASGPDRSRELRDVLDLAGTFPARHAPSLQFPTFGRR